MPTLLRSEHGFIPLLVTDTVGAEGVLSNSKLLLHTYYLFALYVTDY